MQLTLSGKSIIDVSIERIKEFAPKEGKYWLAFSGGKDSVVLKALADMAGVPYEAHYTVMPTDPPEIRAFIKEFHKDVIWDRAGIGLVQLIAKKGFPTRMTRWCCDYYKENSGGERTLLGVRWAESAKRATRKSVEYCGRNKARWIVNPIIDWLDSDVWEFLKSQKIPYCKLYDEGWKRLGCIGCPMIGKEETQKEMDRWPKVMNIWKRGILRRFERTDTKGKLEWENFEDLWTAWIERKRRYMQDPDTDCPLFGDGWTESDVVEVKEPSFK